MNTLRTMMCVNTLRTTWAYFPSSGGFFRPENVKGMHVFKVAIDGVQRSGNEDLFQTRE